MADAKNIVADLRIVLSRLMVDGQYQAGKVVDLAIALIESQADELARLRAEVERQRGPRRRRASKVSTCPLAPLDEIPSRLRRLAGSIEGDSYNREAVCLLRQSAALVQRLLGLEAEKEAR